MCFFFFFNDTATTEIYTLSLHDALPISHTATPALWGTPASTMQAGGSFSFTFANPGFYPYHCQAHALIAPQQRGNVTVNSVNTPPTVSDRKSTRLNSSHLVISYAVFCLK